MAPDKKRLASKAQGGVAKRMVMIASVIVLQAPINTACASEPATYLPMIARLERVSIAPDTNRLPSDGRPWVIVVFKSCCAPNTVAIKWSVDMQSKFGASIGVLGIAVDSPRSVAKVVPWIRAQGASYTVLWDSNHDFMQSLGIKALPMALLLNSDGSEAFRTGWFNMRDAKAIESLIDSTVTPSKSP